MLGIILYGPPAAGKDTITAALHTLDPAYVHFPRLKAGPGRTTGYRVTTEHIIQQLRDRGEIIWENNAYGATYVIDKPELLRRLAAHIPVLHVGQPAAIGAIRAAAPTARWLTIALWCPRNTAAARILDRGTGDVERRLQTWDATSTLSQADLTFRTDLIGAADAATAIHARHRIPDDA